MSDVQHLLTLAPLSCLITIALETPVLMAGLSSVHPMRRRIVSGVWLTACTYPIVILALPLLFDIRNQPSHYTAYLIVAEVFAPLAECVIFSLAFHHAGLPHRQRWRDFAAITVANLVSFLAGMQIPLERWLGLT